VLRGKERIPYNLKEGDVVSNFKI
jgi:Zn-dependent M16 (insulinase) family peptidase